MIAELVIRHNKKLTKAFDMDVPDNTTYLNVPLGDPYAQVTQLTSHIHTQKMLKFTKIKLSPLSVFFVGNIFLCDLPLTDMNKLAL